TGTLPPAARILTSFSRLRRILRGCSSVGRAPALQAGGQGFKSPQLHCIYVHRGTTPLDPRRDGVACRGVWRLGLEVDPNAVLSRWGGCATAFRVGGRPPSTPAGRRCRLAR